MPDKTTDDMPDEEPTFGSAAYLRKLYGMSRAGLALYEKEGLARFTRDETNGYRRYTISDVVRMCNAIDYTRYGFSLRETAGIVLEGDLPNQLSKLEDMGSAYLDQLEDLLAKKRRIDDERAALADYLADPRGCRVVSGREIYQLPIHSNSIVMGEGLADADAWWTQAPFVTTGMTVELEGRVAVDAQHGPVADGCEVRRLALPTHNAIRFCTPEQTRLRAFVLSRANGLPTEDGCAHIWEYLRAKGLERTCGRVLHRLLRHFERDGERSRRGVARLRPSPAASL